MCGAYIHSLLPVGSNAARRAKFLKVFIDFPTPFGYTIEVLRREPRYGKIEAWLSLVERSVRDAEAASSNLVASTYIRFTNRKS